MSGNVDPAVILAAQKGDREAFEEIVRFYQKVVLSVAFYITGSRDDAEDICQDAFLKFYRYMHSFLPHRGSLKSYLYRLVANAAYQHLSRSQNRRGLETAIESLPVDALGTEDVPFSGGVEMVEKLLEELTPRERGIFVMHEVAEMDYDEIAGSLKISQITARRFHSMARQKLQALITQRYPEYKESE